jgi:hypothetical protein
MRWVVLLAGCLFSPHYDDGRVHCEQRKCPMGVHCALDDTCWLIGHEPDLAGVDLAGVDFAGSDGSGDGNVDGSSNVQVMPSRNTIELLAFPAPTPHPEVVTATVTGAPPGQETVTFTVLSGSSAEIVGPASGVTMATLAPVPQAFPASAPPAPTVVRATSDADANAFADITVHVHAWVDESLAVQNLYAQPVQLWTAATSAQGDVVVAGRTLMPAVSPSPVAAYRDHATGMWSRLDGTLHNTEGVYTSAAFALAGTEIALGGVTGPTVDVYNNRRVLLVDCKSPPSCAINTNLGSAFRAFASSADRNNWKDEANGYQSWSTNPYVAVTTDGIGTFRWLALSRAGAGTCGTGPNNSAFLAYSDAFDVAPNISATAYISAMDRAYPDNSCPFADADQDTTFLGMTSNNAGNLLWLSGDTICAPAGGCLTTSPYGVFTRNATAGYYTYQQELSWGNVGMTDPSIAAGYNDTVLGISTSTAWGMAVAWWPSGTPATTGGYQHIVPPGISNELGLAVGGGDGTAPWANGAKGDIFYSVMRTSVSPPTYHFVWQLGDEGRRVYDSGTSSPLTGTQILHIAFSRTVPTEGWAVGAQLGSGGVTGAFVAHLQ